MAAKWILGNKKRRRNKRRPKQNGAKILGRYKRNKNSKYAAVRRITGRFAKRFSANGPFRTAAILPF